jgi:hypothetical protein
MYVSVNKQPISFQNFFGVQFRLCQGKSQKKFSDYEYLHGQHNTV